MPWIPAAALPPGGRVVVTTGRWRQALLGGALGAVGVLAGCEPATVTPVPGYHPVTVSWEASHQRGVNAAGGGYRVALAGTTVDLPYPAPTTLTTVLYTGAYTVSVQAYQRDPRGRTAVSPPSSLLVRVP